MATKGFEPTNSKKAKVNKLNPNSKYAASNTAARNATAVSQVNDLGFRWHIIW